MSANPMSNSSSSITSTNLEGEPRCNTHRKRLKFFCSKHDVLLCSLCAVKRHRGCDDILTIVEACEDKRNEANRHLDVFNKKVALIENAIVERKAAKKLLDTNAQEIQNEIHELTNKLIDIVKHEERVLMENVQTMQNRESETLEKDIASLEETRSSFRTAQGNVSHILQLNEIDLIHAVIKERERTEDIPDVDTIVKKRFREIDFKFVISPHVSSFLKHFKNLGQVMMSEESGNESRVQRSNMSTQINEIPQPSPSLIWNGNRNNSRQQSNRNSPNESHSAAHERLAEDRLQQTQSHVHETSDDNVFMFYENHPNNYSQEKHFVKYRTVARPETPEIYERPKNNTSQREFVTRPMSTPPVDRPVYTSSPKSNDFERYGQLPQFRFGRPEYGKLTEKQLHAPGPMKALPLQQTDQQNGRNEVYHSEPVHAFQLRTTSDVQLPRSERPNSPRNTSQSAANNLTYSIVSVKEADTNFGRSFAAVQITDAKGHSDVQNEVIAPSFATSKQNFALNESKGFQISDRKLGSQTDVFGKNDNLNDSHSNAQYSKSGSQDKNKRWVHKLSFTLNGIGSKRLITGIAILPDGRVVLVDQEYYTVQLHDWNFNFVSELKLDSRPFDVISIGDNKIAVSLQSERVLRFIIVTNEGLAFVADLTVPCDLVCYGICRGGRNYCVCCGDEILILSDEGRVVNRLKVDKTGSSLFRQAEYVSMDSIGKTIFVSDTGLNKILAIQIDGIHLWEFYYQGFKPAGLNYIDHVLYVCDRDQHRVLALNGKGKVIKQSVVGRLEHPRALCINGLGNQMLVTQVRLDAINPVHVYVYQ